MVECYVNVLLQTNSSPTLTRFDRHKGTAHELEDYEPV